jgi:hypothetical protein
MKKRCLIICSGLICLGMLGLYLDHAIANNTLGTITGGCGSGPCYPWGSCGGTGGGMGSCKPDNDGICGGQCTPYCPSGYLDWYCAGAIGSCVEWSDYCSMKITYKCFNRTFGLPSCVCTQWGIGASCSRSLCKFDPIAIKGKTHA